MQFTSQYLRMKLRYWEKCVHSPMDDLESFFHVFVWAIVHHTHIKELLDGDRRDYSGLYSGNNTPREEAQRILLRRLRRIDTLEKLCEVAEAWRVVNNDLLSQWNRMETVYKSLDEDGFFKQGGMQGKDYWRWAWHLTAFNGVLRILKMIYSFR